MQSAQLGGRELTLYSQQIETNGMLSFCYKLKTAAQLPYVHCYAFCITCHVNLCTL